MHLLAPKDARVLHGTHANGGGAYLLPSKSSATGGFTPLRTNAGGSILPKIDPGGSVLSGVNAGGSISPPSMNMFGQLSKTLQQGGKADQEHASRPKLVQVSSIHLLHWGPTFGNN